MGMVHQVAEVPQGKRSGVKGIAGSGPFTLQGGVYAPLGELLSLKILVTVVEAQAGSMLHAKAHSQNALRGNICGEELEPDVRWCSLDCLC